MNLELIAFVHTGGRAQVGLCARVLCMFEEGIAAFIVGGKEVDVADGRIVPFVWVGSNGGV